MTLPFTMDAPARRPRKVTVTINADPDRNLSAIVRLTYKLTQQELADRLGCHLDTVQKIEAGGKPSKQMGRKLLKLLPRKERLDFLGIPHRCR